MANRLAISAEAWAVIYPIRVAHRRVGVGAEAACRAFLAAVPWVLRSGVPWRLRPPEHGPWHRVFKRCSRWCRQGVCEA